ncbi:MAG: regulatory protein RecX [Gammaproteobacteria bacterium]|jgi:regulatory protein|nr:regulatory protein RecX [Gammaproteobacteria bacterium]MBT4145683.1 regulatory protein RecX [Gammaproteobacteria bacterium]MBT5223126.1 regulatory protein RecX [Gammaproteobacteria bacterium]MBT5826379.1 regulatory protein RecX [Gammaproteobacteria bacterium]MBT6420912.1 regulatory protein RecX [Gammaproteobacteria bacterium]
MHNDKENYKAIHEACLRYLVRRDHSRHELLQKVSAKGFAKQEIAQVIDELMEQGLQSDARFAESYARSRVHKGFGPLHIQAELQQRGVSNCPFDMAVEDITGSWEELLEQVYSKKYGNKPIVDRREKLKRSRFLQQRGFPTELVRRLFK